VPYQCHFFPWGTQCRNTDGSRILQVADGLNSVICNALSIKQEAKLVSYKYGPAKNTADYIPVRQYTVNIPIHKHTVMLQTLQLLFLLLALLLNQPTCTFFKLHKFTESPKVHLLDSCTCLQTCCRPTNIVNVLKKR